MKKKVNFVAKTNGKGPWTKTAQEVQISKIEWEEPKTFQDEDDELVELEPIVYLYWKPGSWNRANGLIYRDPLFLEMAKEALMKLAEQGILPSSLPWEKLGYTEQGQQGEKYVHLILGDW